MFHLNCSAFWFAVNITTLIRGSWKVRALLYMCGNIKSTTVCLLCPLGNKPSGHSGCPYGTASVSVGQCDHTCILCFWVFFFFKLKGDEEPGENGGKCFLLIEIIIITVIIKWKQKKSAFTGSYASPRINRHPDGRKWNLLCELSSHVCCMSHAITSRGLEKRPLIFDIAVTFGCCQRAINKGVWRPG